jgi:hypothetical protein
MLFKTVLKNMNQYESIGSALKKHEKMKKEQIRDLDWFKVFLRLFVYFFLEGGNSRFSPPFFIN